MSFAPLVYHNSMWLRMCCHLGDALRLSHLRAFEMNFNHSSNEGHLCGTCCPQRQETYSTTAGISNVEDSMKIGNIMIGILAASQPPSPTSGFAEFSVFWQQWRKWGAGRWSWCFGTTTESTSNIDPTI